jgi:hypothetical protein
VFSNLPSLHLSSNQIFSSTPCSQASSVHDLPWCQRSSFAHINEHSQNYSLYILIFMFLDSRWEGKKVLEWMVESITLIQSPLNFLQNRVFVCYSRSQAFSKHLLAIFMSWFPPAFWWRDSNIYLVFSVFISRPTFILALVKVSVFYLWYLYYHPIHSRHQHRPAADVSHLIAVPPGFPGLS